MQYIYGCHSSCLMRTDGVNVLEGDLLIVENDLPPCDGAAPFVFSFFYDDRGGSDEFRTKAKYADLSCSEIAFSARDSHGSPRGVYMRRSR
jgi:hypothetical protein